MTRIDHPFQSLFDGKVPLVIGITGHRNIQQHETQIAETARRECEKLKAAYPHSPFLVISALAEGADMVLTEVIMKTLSAKLVALLPLPPEVYEQDFEIEGSKEKYYKFLDQASGRVELFDRVDAPLWISHGEPRNIQYAKAGGVTAEQAQILFAVWDGEKARGTGGTADIVTYFRHGTPKKYSGFGSEISPLDPIEPGLLVHINREGKLLPTEGPSITIFGRSREDIDDKRRNDSRRSTIRDILRATNRFNGDVDAHVKLESVKHPLLGPVSISHAPKDIGTTYHTADELAQRFSTKVKNADWVLYGAAVLAVFSFNLLNNYPVASAVYLVTTLMMLVAATYSRSYFLDNRFREYRALAEAMRVAFFWRLGGIKRQVWLCYLSQHSGLVHWVRHAVRTIEFTDKAQNEKTERGAGADLDLIETHWIKDQMRYYLRAGDRNRWNYWFWHIVFVATFGVSLILALAFFSLAITKASYLFDWKDAGSVTFLRITGSTESFVEFLQIVLGVVAASAITAKAFSGRRAHHELMKQYASAQQTFSLAYQALQDIKQGNNPNDWQPKDILTKAGMEALQEQGEWLWLRHSRPFEPPTAT